MNEHGVVIWCTGIPASGKSTIAGLVEQRLGDMGLPVENLDADEVRENLSPNLGYTEEARDENTKRLAWMAHMLSKHGVNVLVAAVSPLRRYRERAREWCPDFVEVAVSCPLEVCKQRDPKGLYARAERGEINDIAGWHLPYEAPQAPEVALDTVNMEAEQCADLVMEKLAELDYVTPIGIAETEAYSEEDAERVEERLKDLGYL